MQEAGVLRSRGAAAAAAAAPNGFLSRCPRQVFRSGLSRRSRLAILQSEQMHKAFAVPPSFRLN